MKTLPDLNTSFSMLMNEENHQLITSYVPIGEELWDTSAALVTRIYRKHHRVDVCYKKARDQQLGSVPGNVELGGVRQPF